ncbi:MAG: magnesium chelatase subunit D [Silicimonas sp.]|nr:magnesium chelatase subunit D [Silicimonas sp.]
MDAPLPLDQAKLALTLLAIDPVGLGGIVIRGRAGPARDALVADLSALPRPHARIAPTVTDAQLNGGLDVARTLSNRKLVHAEGALGNAATLLLPMAERLTPERAARLASALDEGRTAIALDEGIDDEVLARVLEDRLAFRIETDMIPARMNVKTASDPDVIRKAQSRLTKLPTCASDIEALATLAAQFGIHSLRALHLAFRCARAHAALMTHETVDEADILVAGMLVLAHRATQMPSVEDEHPDNQPQDTPDDAESKPQNPTLDDDILLEAVKAALPPDLLARLSSGRIRRATGSGSGAKKRGNRRGRPLPARQGKLDGTTRLDIVATLRAAAPWQTIRAKSSSEKGVHIRPNDFHIKRFEETSDRLLVFAVDASGSAAFARLAEAKGAVELLLAEAYARRDHVALVAFRGEAAEVLLPPTRSLVQTKRRLAALPGGGGTPLAAGLQAALEVARTAARKGLTPTIALLTDGRANIALDGQPNRKDAREDAKRLAQMIAAEGVETLVIDTGTRPEPDLKTLSQTALGHYIPLPRADAKRLATAVSDALA